MGNIMNALYEFCRIHEGVISESSMRPEDAIDKLLDLLSDLEAHSLNPMLPDLSGEPQTVAYFADWIDQVKEESVWHPLDNLWSYINDIIGAEGFEVTTHPDDPACIIFCEVEPY